VSNCTTVEYQSNLEPLEGEGRPGSEYLSKIHDPFALEALKKYLNFYSSGYTLTGIQQSEMQAASGHCAYAYKDDYPWGTVTLDGHKRVVCKCTNRSCSQFNKCRRGISEWRDGEDQLNLPEKTSKDYSEDKKEGARFIQELTGKVPVSGTQNINSAEENQLVDSKNCINPKTDDASEYLEETGVELESADSVPVINSERSNDKKKTNSFEEWLEQKGQNQNYVRFYTGSLKSIDMLAHNHGLWDGNLIEKNIAEAEGLLKAFRSLEVSGRERIMMRQLLQVIDLYRKYLEDTLSAKNTSPVPEPSGPAVQPENLEITGSTANEKSEELTNKTDAPDSESGIKNEDDESHQDISREERTDKAEPKTEDVSPLPSADATLSFESFTDVKQENIIEAPITDKIIVNAGPGTGKTYTLIARIINLVNVQEVDPDQILVLCFSRAAVEVIEKRLEDAYREERIGINWHSVEIRTFDSFATFNLAWAMKEDPETLPDGFSLQGKDYDSRIVAATEQLKNHRDVISECRHFIVDEVQDLVSARADFVEQIIKSLPEECGYTLLGDACQSIYDYQMQSGQTGSADFYRWLFTTQKEAHLYSLGINYRQTSNLENTGNKFRETILSGNLEKMKEGLAETEKAIRKPEKLNLKRPDIDVLNNVAQDGSLGILTRTNGQALLISTWLRAADIPHTVQKRLSDHEYDRWIADVFCEYPNDTVTYDEFENYAGKTAGIDPERCTSLWEALVNTQYDRDRERYSISDLLRGIAENGKSRELYTSDINEKITVSNIHRSKGREYDRVIVLDDILGDTDQENNAEEYRVSYVAITRAKREILRTGLGQQYIYLDKNGDRRAYECGFNWKKNKKLTHIEIGRPRDLNLFSMAGKESQKIINELIPGTSVSLTRDRERSEANGYVTYTVRVDGETGIITLGETGREFSRALKRILRSVKNLPDNCDLYDYLYPDDITDVYIDDVITVINPYKPEADGAKRYGNMMIWRAISLTGFGRLSFGNY